MLFREWSAKQTKNKKTGKRDPIQPTATSSPLKGPNQDQSGVGVSHDTADYSISDEVNAN